MFINYFMLHWLKSKIIMHLSSNYTKIYRYHLAVNCKGNLTCLISKFIQLLEMLRNQSYYNKIR